MKRLSRVGLMCGLWLLTLSACKTTPTQVIVLIDAEEQTQALADSVEITVEGRGDRTLDGEVKFSERVEFGNYQWPIKIALQPSGGDAERVFRVSARAYDGDMELVAASVISSYVDGEVRWLRLMLEDSCLGVSERCAGMADRTCHAGECVDAFVPSDKLSKSEGDATDTRDTFMGVDGGMAPTPDAGPDNPDVDSGTEDAGKQDAGKQDAGKQDAGAMDSGMVDGGMDASNTCVEKAETCNGEDDDCDGDADEALTQDCGQARGICTAGTQVCTAGSWGPCLDDSDMPVVTALDTEICDGLLDEDCDDGVDEMCECTGSMVRDCGETRGTCEPGKQTCDGMNWGTCEGAVGPATEICDNKNNDCDDAVDEMLTRSCGTNVGECVAGTETCSAGAWGACVDEVPPAAESCDGLDQDCDGWSDEALGCVRGTPSTFDALFRGAAPPYNSGQLNAIDVHSGGDLAVTGYVCTDFASESCDIWVGRLSPQGAVRWSRTFDNGFTGYQYFLPDVGKGVRFDSQGNVVVAGHVCNGGTEESCDIWVRKYPPDGGTTPIFTSTVNVKTDVMDPTMKSQDDATGVAVDGNDNVIVAGYTSLGYQNEDVWIRKYDPSGTELWTVIFNSTGSRQDVANAVAVDSQNNVIVAGYKKYSSDTNVWLAKYAPDGNQLWLREYDNGSSYTYAAGKAVDVDSQDNILVAFDYTDAAMNRGIGILKYDFDGSLIKTVPMVGQRYVTALAVDAADHVVLAIEAYNGSSPGTGYDFRAQRWTPNLVQVWQRDFDYQQDRDSAYGIATDAQLNVHVVGYMNDSTNVQGFGLRTWGP